MIRASRLPLIVAAIAVPTVAALFVGGVELAALVAIVVLLAIVLLAVRAKPREPIEVADDHGGRRRILLAVSEPVDDHRTAAQIARAARTGTGSVAEILVVAPTQPGFLDRWASDPRNAEREAEHKLEVTVASLAEEHLRTRGEIGGPELLLAIEDTLRAYPADEVMLATGSPEEDRAGAHAADELRDRLSVPFEHLVVGSADGQRS